MVSVLLSWIVILLCSLATGYFVIRLLYKDSDFFNDTYEIYVIVGLGVLTIYAQIYSLFGGIGKVAFAFLAVICGGLLAFEEKRDRLLSNFIKKYINLSRFDKILFAVIVMGCVLWTSIVPQHYDTYLYHAQAIRWNETYGVVPGLGNIHFRLAYNSAFIPLQALFSFSWLNGQSYHTLNGFFTVVIMSYMLLSFGKAEEIKVSDITKCGAILYILYDSFHVSSPNTDTIALLLTYYILVKWIELYEKDEQAVSAYAILCVMAVYAVTLKLSVCIVLLLVIYPAYILIKSHKWRTIVRHLMMGITVIIPYLIRNVIVSGYLVYPYEKIKFTKVDWLMPQAILEADRAEIIAWGRGNQDTSRNGEHIWQWIGDWYNSINILWKIMCLLTIVALVYIMIFIIPKKITNNMASYCILIYTCFIEIVFWLFTAPLPRYGAIHMIFLVCVALGELLQTKKKRMISIRCLVAKCRKQILMCLGVVYVVLFIGYSAYYDLYKISLINQSDYANKETRYELLDGIVFAFPVNGDQTGYEPFPSSPYVGMVNSVELRGETLKDGFRTK